MPDEATDGLTTPMRTLLVASMTLMAGNCTNEVMMDANKHLHSNLDEGDPFAKELEAALAKVGEATNELNDLASQMILSCGQKVRRKNIGEPDDDVEIRVLEEKDVPDNIKLILAQLTGGLTEI